jgi:phosphate transport system substrate-binding protein
LFTRNGKSRRLIASALLILSLFTLIAFSGCGTAVPSGSTAGTVTEAGSTTVQPLAEKFASAFMAAKPGTTVTIQGGGSGVGIKSANDGTVDIGAASRELTPEDPALNKILIARDGIALIANNANKVTGLSRSQVIDIYSGKIKDWSEVGGTAGSIHVVAREEGSGTRTAFQEMVMGKTMIVNTAILQSSNGAIRTTVAGDARAIGFLSFGYIDKEIKALSIEGVAATEENAQNGKYPVVRPLYFLTKTQPAGTVKAFLDYCIGPEGQKIVATEGYLPVK